MPGMVFRGLKHRLRGEGERAGGFRGLKHLPGAGGSGGNVAREGWGGIG